MKDNQKTIQKICDMAINHYDEESKPELFAAKAAHLFTMTASSSETAAFIGAHYFALSIIELTKELTSVSNIKIQMNAKYTRARGQQTAEFEQPSDTLKSLLDSITKQKSNIIFNNELDEQGISACSTYPYVYTTAYAAYNHAIGVTANIPDTERRKAFLAAITERLFIDLNPHPINPSFFLQMMCSDVIKVIGAVLFVAGLLALSIAGAGAILPSVASAIEITNLSITTIGLTSAASATTGFGVLYGHFFAKEKREYESYICRKAVMNLNAVGV